MKTYKTYKDSGVDWLGRIPKEWDKKRLKDLCSIKTGNKNTEDRVDGGKYPFFVRSKKVEKINSYSFDGDAILTAGDGDIGKIFHHINGKFGFHQRVYAFYDFKIKSRFIYYYLKSNLYNKVSRESAKVTVGSLRLPMLESFVVSVPSKDEQDAIANYLDDKVGSLDKLIPALDDQIKNMKDYKKSLIRESLETESIEDIKIKKPTITRLFKMGDIITGNTPIRKTEGIYSEKKTDYEWYSVTDMLNISKDKPTGYLTELGIKKARSVPKGSFLCACIGSTIGKSIVASKKVFINQAINAVVPNNKNNGKYIYYHFLANPDMLKEKAEINVIPIVNKSLFSKIEIPRHEKEEQDLIVKFLDKKVRDIDEAIIALKEQKQNMIDYKKALIHDVVTGKIKVYEEE